MRKPRMHLPFDNWPAGDQARWHAAFKTGDRFDDSGPGEHLAQSTRTVLREAYARFLGYIVAHRPELLGEPPSARIDRLIVADYVGWRRRFCSDVMVAIDLDHLRGALKLICPGVDWSWLLTITKRIAAMAPRRPPKAGETLLRPVPSWLPIGENPPETCSSSFSVNSRAGSRTAATLRTSVLCIASLLIINLHSSWREPSNRRRGHT